MSLITTELLDQITLHEGFRISPYYDTEGVLTWGVGRNLVANPLTEDEILYILEHGRKEGARYCLSKDAKQAVSDCEALFAFFPKLSEIRQRVLIDMAFNLGRTRLNQFVKMAAALECDNYKLAAKEMLNSRWARQVGQRANRLARMMESNKDYK